MLTHSCESVKPNYVPETGLIKSKSCSHNPNIRKNIWIDLTKGSLLGRCTGGAVSIQTCQSIADHYFSFHLVSSLRSLRSAHSSASASLVTIFVMPNSNLLSLPCGSSLEPDHHAITGAPDIVTPFSFREVASMVNCAGSSLFSEPAVSGEFVSLHIFSDIIMGGIG